eukprot:4796340-Prymnesium_polylepis.1
MRWCRGGAARATDPPGTRVARCRRPTRVPTVGGRQHGVPLAKAAVEPATQYTRTRTRTRTHAHTPRAVVGRSAPVCCAGVRAARGGIAMLAARRVAWSALLRWRRVAAVAARGAVAACAAVAA